MDLAPECVEQADMGSPRPNNRSSYSMALVVWHKAWLALPNNRISAGVLESALRTFLGRDIFLRLRVNGHICHDPDLATVESQRLQSIYLRRIEKTNTKPIRLEYQP
jgi:hypothetical protein